MADKEHASELIDRLPKTELSAIVGLLEAMRDPLARSLANAPIEDEPISEEETRAVAASKAWLKNHEPIPHEDVLAEFGLTSEDFERMGRTPLTLTALPRPASTISEIPSLVLAVKHRREALPLNASGNIEQTPRMCTGRLADTTSSYHAHVSGRRRPSQTMGRLLKAPSFLRRGNGTL
jgi:hypothetical protein